MLAIKINSNDIAKRKLYFKTTATTSTNTTGAITITTSVSL